MTLRLTTVAAEPSLIPGVAGWLWLEWGRRKGRSIDRVPFNLARRTASVGPEQCFVLLGNDGPVATASLVHDDLLSRPELTPWLASVYVDPAHRGRGHAIRVVRAVEDATRSAGIATLWLHTASAAGLYAGMGWETIGREVDWGHDVTLMRRSL